MASTRARLGAGPEQGGAAASDFNAGTVRSRSALFFNEAK